MAHSPDSTRHALLLRALAGATAEAPTARKLLVAPTRGEGKEWLRTLAREGTGWMAWEVLTLRPLALEIAAARLARKGLEPLDELGEQAIMDEALDEVLSTVEEGPFAELAEGVGFRAALRGALRAVRLAGVDEGRLERMAGPRAAGGSGDRAAGSSDPPSAGVAQSKGRILARVLRAYRDKLDRPTDGHRRVDTADVLREAAEALDEGDPVGYDRVWLLPGLGMRGRAGELADRLVERGAELLPTDPVEGLEVPERTAWKAGEAVSPLSFLHAVDRAPEEAHPALESLDLFHAATLTDELKEVLRRVMEAGLRWDEVEIVASDPGVYGPALHALAARMGIPVTFGVGLPVERTRTGRAVEGFFQWISEDFPSPVLRRLLATGVLTPPPPHHGLDGSRTARRLRRLRIGWGRGRYVPRLNGVLRRLDEPVAPRREESMEEASARVAGEREEVEALRALIQPVLEALPAVPERLDPDPPAVSPAGLARALRVFLERVPRRGEVERTALDRLGRILLRVEAELDRPTDFQAAVTVLREHLDIRVPAPRAEGPAPWRSSGGHLYLSDFQHGGTSGRKATFLVGMDATRVGSGVYQDPLLLDRERSSLSGALPTSADRLHETRFRLAALLARLRGRVTLSYSAWDPAEARSVLPASILLQAFRLARRDAALGYEQLHLDLGDPVSAVPRSPARRVDAADVWLQRLGAGGTLRLGAGRVREAHPWLARGREARAALDAGAEPSVHHGLVEPRPDDLDPRRSRDVVSASRLESLGACPRRYFLRYVLDVKAPEDPTFDPDAWLDALERGSLLHGVYEGALRRARERGVSPDDPAFLSLALEVLEEEARAVERYLPPPSVMVREREMEALRADMRAFAEMVGREADRWIELELAFGLPGSDRPPVEVELPGGSISVRGAIDRVDDRPGGIHLVDYKTGGTSRYEKGGTFHGGRRLQHFLYTRVASGLFDRPVQGLSYHFPTRKAENAVFRYGLWALESGGELVDTLLDMVAAGRFVPTDDEADCRFCDFQAVCRVRDAGYGRPDSPLADWGKAHLDEEIYDELREVRSWTS